MASISVVAFDGSGSFAGPRTLAAQLVRRWSEKYVDTDHKAQLVVFGTSIESFGGLLTSAGEVDSEVERVMVRKPSSGTRLFGGLDDAIKKASESPPGTLREVWMYTDGGEESSAYGADRIDALTQRALAAGVRVSLATLAAPDARSATLTTMDRLREIQRQTGGSEIALAKGFESAWQQLREAADRGRAMSVYDGKLCGLTSGARPTVAVRLVGSGVASRESVRLADPGWAPAAVAPCCTAGACEGAWQVCRGSQCEARSCTADADCGEGGRCEAGKCRGKLLRSRSIALLAGVLLVVGGLIGLAARARRLRRQEADAQRVRAAAEAARREDEERRRREEEASRHASVMAAVTAVSAAATQASTSTEDLPETLLVVIAAGPGQEGQRFRLARRTTAVGANPENNICFPLPSVSGRHAEFQLFPSGALFVQDLNSTNGVFVQGVRLPPGGRAELQAGAQVSLGSAVRLEVVGGGAGAPMAGPYSGPHAGPHAGGTAAGTTPQGAATGSKKKTIYDRGG